MVEREGVIMKNASVRYNSLSNDGSTEDWCSAVVPEERCLRSHFTETDECSRQRVFLQSPIINTVLGSVYNSSSSVDPMEDLVLQLTHFRIESVMVEATLVKPVSNAFLYWPFPDGEAKYPEPLPGALTTYDTSPWL